MTKYFSIFLISCFFGCKTLKDNNNNQKSDWTVESKKKYDDENVVSFEIINNKNYNLVVFDPFLKNIEKYDREKWTKVKTLYCPCGNCPPPPETMTISSKGKHIFNWDKNIVTCENRKKMSQKMESGLYRVIFNYAKSQNVKSFEKLIVEFEI